MHHTIHTNKPTSSSKLFLHKLVIEIDDYSETITHILRYCIKVTPIWSCFHLSQNIFSRNIKQWIHRNARNGIPNKLSIHWNIIFLFTIRTIWSCRNNKIFRNEIHSTETVVKLALDKATKY